MWKYWVCTTVPTRIAWFQAQDPIASSKIRKSPLLQFHSSPLLKLLSFLPSLQLPHRPTCSVSSSLSFHQFPLLQALPWQGGHILAECLNSLLTFGSHPHSWKWNVQLFLRDQALSIQKENSLVHKRGLQLPCLIVNTGSWEVCMWWIVSNELELNIVVICWEPWITLFSCLGSRRVHAFIPKDLYI